MRFDHTLTAFDEVRTKSGRNTSGAGFSLRGLCLLKTNHYDVAGFGSTGTLARLPAGRPVRFLQSELTRRPMCGLQNRTAQEWLCYSPS